jgi:GNAT superfamily N-acetyltransferase
MFHVKIMSEQDFPFAVQITDQMNWDMTEGDFKFMTNLEPEGCFVLLSDAERAGIATTVSFGKKGWFGNLIVEESYRRKGAGSLLVEHSVRYLKSKGVNTVGLFAYVDKVDFYRRLGFEYDSVFTILKGKSFSSATAECAVEPGGSKMQRIIDCDRFCFGASRKKVLEPMLNDPNEVSYICVDEGRVLGYALAKEYDDAASLGPLVCPRDRSDLAISLLEAVLNQLKSAEVSLCLSRKEESVVSWLMKHGFVESFHVARMFLHPSAVGNCVYVAESLERG